MAILKTKIRMLAEELVDGAGGAGELGVIVIVDDDDSLFGEAGRDEAEAGFDRGIEVAVAEGEGDSLGEVLRGEVVEPSFLDNDGEYVGDGIAGSFEAVFAEFFDDFALSDEEFAGFEIGTGAGDIFPGLLGEAGEGVVDPEAPERGRSNLNG